MTTVNGGGNVIDDSGAAAGGDGRTAMGGGATVAGIWVEARPGVDGGFLDRVSARTRRYTWQSHLVMVIFLSIWTVFTVSVIVKGHPDGMAGDAFFVIMWVVLVGIWVWVWRRLRRENRGIERIRQASRQGMLASVGLATLERMCASIGVLDLLRCPDYRVYDDDGTPIRRSEQVTCLAWTPRQGARWFTAYGHVDARSLLGLGRRTMRVVVELNGGWVRLIADRSVVVDSDHGLVKNHKLQDPSWSYGLGILAPRMDLDLEEGYFGSAARGA